MRTQNRGRKSEKMSDNIRRLIGLFMIIICIIICLVPVITKKTAERKFRSSQKTNFTIAANENERHGTVRVNDADTEELTGLPGIGETISALIIDERSENGPFYYVEDLEAVRGIGLRTIERFREMIDLSLNESGEENGISSTVP